MASCEEDMYDGRPCKRAKIGKKTEKNQKKNTRNAILFSKQNKRYANFDFKQEKETGSLLSIPYSWVRSHKKPLLESRDQPSSLDAQNTYAYWPPQNSPDERNVRSLIKKCSEPNVETWVQLPGKLKGVYDSLAEAEEALELLCGETVTESEAERLAAVGEAAARKNSNLVVQHLISQSDSVSVKAQPSSVRHKLNTATSDKAADKRVSLTFVKNPACAKMKSKAAAVKSVSEKPNKSSVPQSGLQLSELPPVEIHPKTSSKTSAISAVQPVVQSSSSQSAFVASVSTNAIPVNLQSDVSVSTMTDQSVEAQNMSDARRKLIDLCAARGNIPPPVPKLCAQQLTEQSGDASTSSSGVMDALNTINSNITAYMSAFNEVSQIFEERLTALHEHLMTVSSVVTEVAEDLAGRKGTAISAASPPRATLPVLGRLKRNALTTPKDVINALGFPVETTPEDLVAMDALFCEPDNPDHKHRRSSLKAALIKSLPKPDGLKNVTAITTARGALLQLADYALWQFFCGSGGSGSSKFNMSNKMPVLYNIILVVIQKITNITEKEAATALSTCLKNTKNRASARKYMEQLRRINSSPTVATHETTADGEKESSDDEGDEHSSELPGSESSDVCDFSDGSSVEPDSDDEDN